LIADVSFEKDNEFIIKVGLRIKEIREKKGITQSELAKLCDKDRQNLNRIEKGHVNISVTYLKIITKNLNISLLDFFNSNLFE
jgi:putative transcriptional regulator